jgi:hypothetical protein
VASLGLFKEWDAMPTLNETVKKYDRWDVPHPIPYQGVCRNRDNRYCPKIEHADFCDGLAVLNDKDRMYLVSYDGRMGEKTYGELLPKRLKLLHIEVHAGRSTQATLLGRDCDTYESLYLSPALAEAMRFRIPVIIQLTNQVQYIC